MSVIVKGSFNAQILAVIHLSAVPVASKVNRLIRDGDGAATNQGSLVSRHIDGEAPSSDEADLGAATG